MSLKVLSDRIAVELLPGVGMVGLLHIPDITKSSRNQTFTRAKVYSIGPDALGMSGVLLYEEVLVSEHFGDEVEVAIDPETTQTLRVGRLRDIVGVFRSDGLTARADRVLLEKIERDPSVGGILLPNNVRYPNLEARVLSAGPDASLQKGDRVLLSHDGAGVVIPLDGKQMMLAKESDVLAIL